MPLERRQSERFDVILVIEFRALKKTHRYFPGVTRNFSHDGLSFEYHSCAIDPGEVLDLKLKHLRKQFSVSALGKIVWVKRTGLHCEAGVRFLAMNREARSRLLELTSMYDEMPWESFYYGSDAGPRTSGGTAETSLPDSGISREEEATEKNIHTVHEDVSRPARTETDIIADARDDYRPTSEIDVPSSINGRQKKGGTITTITKVLAAIILSIGIILYEDINIRIPEEERMPGDEMTHETAEAPAVTDTMGKEPEPVLEADSQEEQMPDAGREIPYEITIGAERLLSQPLYPDHDGGFFEVGRFVIAMGIADREPIGITNTFSALAGTVYCFLEARNIIEDGAVTLIWYHEDTLMAEVELPLMKGDRWRTYSSKKLNGMRGSWRVELQDSRGSVLEVIRFTVN